ncbi:MAG: hypothetical protein V4466_11425, partial [Pseudomonadota bacterium]
AGLLSLVGVAPAISREPPSAAPLVGSWRVDLTSEPGAEPYYAEMIINSVEGDRITGLFYDSPMEQGRITRDWGTIRFAFVTHDKDGGAYNTSGEFVDGRLIRGVTHALGRDFLSIWTADRKAP